MDFGEILPEPAVAFGRADEPIERLGQEAIIKHRDAGVADTGVGVVGGFKVDGGDSHSLAKVWLIGR